MKSGSVCGGGGEAITEIVWALGLSFAVIAFKIVTLNCPSIRNSLIVLVHWVSAYFCRLSLFTILNWFGLSCFSPRIFSCLYCCTCCCHEHAPTYWNRNAKEYNFLVKGKGENSLCTVWRHIERTICITPLISNLSNMWTSVVSFTLRPLHSGKERWCPLSEAGWYP